MAPSILRHPAHPALKRQRTRSTRLVRLSAIGLLIGALLAPLAGHAKPAQPPAPPPSLYADQPAAMALADEIAQRHALDPAWVRERVGQAQRVPAAIRFAAPAPSGTAKNWTAYRARFIEPRRLQAGVRFWQQNAATLARAQATFGVPDWLIVGVIGVETLYGQHMGQHRVLDSLTTLALDFPVEHPRRANRMAFFREELGHFLYQQSQAGLDPREPRGSYAGAMGLPQFMPSSVARYAVDFDGDGRIDLGTSTADAIGSVANYFQAFGWTPGQPTHYPAVFDPATLDLPTLLAPDIRPTFGAQDMIAKGVRLDDTARQHVGPLALVMLENGDPARGGTAPHYVVGTQNFYVVTRYNWSSYYALAVIDLGQTVRDSVAKTPQKAPPRGAETPAKRSQDAIMVR